MEFLFLLIVGLLEGFCAFVPVCAGGAAALAGHLFGQTSLVLPAVAAAGAGCMVAWFVTLSKDFKKYLFDSLRMFFKLLKKAGALISKNEEGGSSARIVRTKGERFTLLCLAAAPVYIILSGVFAGAAAKVASSLLLTGACYLITAVVFVVAERIPARKAGPSNVPLPAGFLAGLFAAAAVLPGISGLALLIVFGRLLGFNQKNSVRFSARVMAPALFFQYIASLLKGQWPQMSVLGNIGVVAAVAAAYCAARFTRKKTMNLTLRENFLQFALASGIAALVTMAFGMLGF